MKKFKVFLWLLGILLIIIQFIRPAKNLNPAAQPGDITLTYPTPAYVQVILKKACYDCHSNNTAYPWYANIQPVAWWLNSHITDGKRHLNFNEFTTYRVAKQYHKLEETSELVEHREMPLASYTWIHTDAKLNDEERKQVTDWCESVRAIIKAQYPADSLILKKKKSS